MTQDQQDNLELKRLLTLLLEECTHRNFKTLSSKGEIHSTGICGILSDMRYEDIFTASERWVLQVHINFNRPGDTKDNHWWDSTIEGNQKRVEFLEMLISKLN